jgi:hypothetical protein
MANSNSSEEADKTPKTLEEKLEGHLQAMYLHALPVRNLDEDGRVESPDTLEKALSLHLPRVLSLIQEDRERLLAAIEADAPRI